MKWMKIALWVANEQCSIKEGAPPSTECICSSTEKKIERRELTFTFKIVHLVLLGEHFFYVVSEKTDVILLINVVSKEKKEQH